VEVTAGPALKKKKVAVPAKKHDNIPL